MELRAPSPRARAGPAYVYAATRPRRIWVVAPMPCGRGGRRLSVNTDCERGAPYVSELTDKIRDGVKTEMAAVVDPEALDRHIAAIYRDVANEAADVHFPTGR